VLNIRSTLRKKIKILGPSIKVERTSDTNHTNNSNVLKHVSGQEVQETTCPICTDAEVTTTLSALVQKKNDI
jgi:protein-disulfide isomerase